MSPTLLSKLLSHHKPLRSDSDSYMILTSHKVIIITISLKWYFYSVYTAESSLLATTIRDRLNPSHLSGFISCRFGLITIVWKDNPPHCP